MTSCPNCNGEIEADELDEFDVNIGDRLRCKVCRTHLEVVNVSPVELELESDDSGDSSEEQTGDGTSLFTADKDDDWQF